MSQQKRGDSQHLERHILLNRASTVKFAVVNIISRLLSATYIETSQVTKITASLPNSQAHQLLTEAERKKICRLMDYQRLSREACAHAAQNDRLPVQTVVQVLFYEQQRIRDSASSSFIGGDSPAPSHKSGYSTNFDDPADELLKLKRENDNLKLELVKMRMQMKEAEKPASVIKMSSADKPPLPKKSFMNSVSKKLGRLYPFLRSENGKEFTEKTKMKPPKNWRHSFS